MLKTTELKGHWGGRKFGELQEKIYDEKIGAQKENALHGRLHKKANEWMIRNHGDGKGMDF